MNGMSSSHNVFCKFKNEDVSIYQYNVKIQIKGFMVIE